VTTAPGWEVKRVRPVESWSADNVGPTRAVRDLFMARRVLAETGSYATVYCTHRPTASREPLFQFRKFPNRVCPSSCDCKREMIARENNTFMVSDNYIWFWSGILMEIIYYKQIVISMIFI